MSIFDRPANYDQRFYNAPAIEPVKPIAPANPIHNRRRGHVSDGLYNEESVSDKPMVNNVPIQAAAAEAEMWRVTEELEREATQKGLKVDIIV